MTNHKSETKVVSKTGPKPGSKIDSKAISKTDKADAQAESKAQSHKLPAKQSFSEWYHELLITAEIIDNRYPVKGKCVWFPLGFAIRKNGRLTRTLGISLAGAPPGEYSLTLTVKDEKNGETLVRKEPFTVAP